MISTLSGVIRSKTPPHLLLEVGGVGYEVIASMQTFYQMAGVNQSTTLLTHLHVREDQHTLYGFADHNEREMFRMLLKVSGIGAKGAMTILSSIELYDFIQAIELNDINTLTKIPGIGKKTAERLAIECRDRLQKLNLSAPSNHNTPGPNASRQDALAALEALGYKNAEAKRALKAIEKPEHDTQTLIRLALQHMVQGVNA